MLLEKNGAVVNVTDKDCVAGYVNEGWKEKAEQTKPAKKAENTKK